ncbi:hypothetical protein BDW66DRAFT_155719 [Aspergillus desertorum]
MDRPLSIATPSRPFASLFASSSSVFPVIASPRSTLINILIELLYISASMGLDSRNDLPTTLVYLSDLNRNVLLGDLVELFLLLILQKLLGFIESRTTAGCVDGHARPVARPYAKQLELESHPTEPAEVDTEAEAEPELKAEVAEVYAESIVDATSTSAAAGSDFTSASVPLPKPEPTPGSYLEHSFNSRSESDSISSSASELVTRSKSQGLNDNEIQTDLETESQTRDPPVVNEEQDEQHLIGFEPILELASDTKSESQDQHKGHIWSERQTETQRGLQHQDQDGQYLIVFEPASDTEIKRQDQNGLHSGDQKENPLLVEDKDQVQEERISAGSDFAPGSESKPQSEPEPESSTVTTPESPVEEEEKSSVSEHQSHRSEAASGPSILRAKPGALILRQKSGLSAPQPTVSRTRSSSRLRSSSLSRIKRLRIPLSSAMPQPSPSNVPDLLTRIPPKCLQLPFVDEHINRSILKDNKYWHSVEFAHEQLAAANLTRAQDFPNCDLREPVVSDCFEKRWINDRSGFGLVATKHIPAGTVIIADELITMWSDEHRKCKSYEDMNEMLQEKAAEMGPEWNKEFLALAEGQRKKDFAIRRRRLGVEGAIWDEHALPMAWEGRVGEVLGLNLACVNHSCVPNCVLRFRNEYPTNTKGEVCYGKKPNMERAVVRACADIKPNVEITIAYMQTEGTVKERRTATGRRFGFHCACRFCAPPHPSVDKGMCYYRRLKRRMEDPSIISDKPAIAYLHASVLLDQLAAIRVQDSRVADIWIKCAMIAGHHTDLPRAWCFLRKARQLCLVLEGLSGASYHQVEGWYRDPTSMPGFGGTRRGLSSRMKAFTDLNQGIMPKEMLFMLDAKPNEYITVSRYHPLPRIEYDKGPCYEIIDGPNLAPAELKFDSRSPSGMCPTHDSCETLVEQLDHVRENRRHRERRAQVMADGHDLEPDCPGFMQDFLAAFMTVARERFGKDTVDAELERVQEDSEGAPNRDAHDKTFCGEARVGPGCAHEQNEADFQKASRACDENASIEKPDKKENKEIQMQHPTVGARSPLVKHVGAEKKPQVVHLEDFVYCDAGVGDLIC